MMNKYEFLVDMADKEKIPVIELPFKSQNGRIKNNRIYIRADLTTVGKACATAEELGHYYTGVGDILEQNNIDKVKQEKRGKVWAYNQQIGLAGIIRAYKAGCQNLYEMSDYLDITEEFLQEALEYYHSKYGICIVIDNYVIYFEPVLAVFELTA